jgi:hypothetical protein
VYSDPLKGVMGIANLNSGWTVNKHNRKNEE